MEYFQIIFSKDCPLNFCFDHELECQTHESGYKKVSQHIIYLYNFRYIHHFSLWQLRPTISRKNMNAVTSLSKALQIKSYTPLIKFSGWYNDTYKKYTNKSYVLHKIFILLNMYSTTCFRPKFNCFLKTQAPNHNPKLN